jgi:hypothetical protein
MAAGGVEIVVGRPNKVQVVTLYGRPANLPGPLTKLVHVGALIRLVCVRCRARNPHVTWW